jgi:hypothetical protein
MNYVDVLQFSKLLTCLMARCKNCVWVKILDSKTQFANAVVSVGRVAKTTAVLVPIL